jgi:hypothetical protein
MKLIWHNYLVRILRNCAMKPYYTLRLTLLPKLGWGVS